MSDRKVGALLTPSMRDFYRETPDAQGSKARNVRQRTRDRFVAALDDVDLLFATMRDDDRRAIVDKIEAQQLDTYLEKFIAIFARELDVGRLEGIIQSGVKRALALEGYPAAEVMVHVTVDREPVDVKEVIEKIAEGGSPTTKEAWALVNADLDDLTEEELNVLFESAIDVYPPPEEGVEKWLESHDSVAELIQPLNERGE